MTPELQLSFRRGVEELTLELCHDIATAEIVVNCRHVGGANNTDRADRFADIDQASEYLHFVESRLLTESWTRTQVRRWTREAVPPDAGSETSGGRPTAQVYRMNAAATPPGGSATGVAQPERAETAAPAAADVESTKGIYALETPLVCPLCREWIRSIKVVRLSRTQAPFTSTLPRSGRAMACSACDGVLSLELSGFL